MSKSKKYYRNYNGPGIALLCNDERIGDAKHIERNVGKCKVNWIRGDWDCVGSPLIHQQIKGIRGFSGLVVVLYDYNEVRYESHKLERLRKSFGDKNVMRMFHDEPFNHATLTEDSYGSIIVYTSTLLWKAEILLTCWLQETGVEMGLKALNTPAESKGNEVYAPVTDPNVGIFELREFVCRNC